MATIIKAADDAGLLALMPHLLGMHPHNSVVLLGFSGNRTNGGLRFDLPEPAASRSSLVYKRLSRAYVGMLGKLQTADGVIVVVVTDEEFGMSAVPPHMELAAQLTRTIEHSRFALKGVLCRAGDGWAPYFDPDVPPGGYPLSDLIDADTATQLPADRPEPFDPSNVPSRIPDAREDLKMPVMADFRRVSQELKVGGSDDVVPIAPGERSGFTELMEEVLGSGDEDFAENAAEVLVAAQNFITRDLILLQWASGERTARSLWNVLLSAGPPPDRTALVFGTILFGDSLRPDPDRLAQAIAFITKLVSCADDAVRPGPLYILAWLHWALGHGTLAFLYLAEASRLAPELDGVEHLDWMLRNGVLPAWAFDRDDDRDDDGDDGDYGDDYDYDYGEDADDDTDSESDDDLGGDSVHLHHHNGNEHE
jgi:hypothetical protein